MSARILIIEDNPANMDLMVYLLTSFGHEPSRACDGEEGTQMAQREMPDLVLCDVNLPKMDGYAVVRNIKSHAHLRDIPVVAVTALAMVGDREKVLNAGFDGYIAKPIEPDVFMSTIEKYLRADLRTQHVMNTSSSMAQVAPASSDSHARILVVDDSPVNRELARSTLEPFGYKVLLANSVRQGWDRAQQEHIDLVLCDLHMPDEDGFELVRKFKADQRLADIPVMFLSASSKSTDEYLQAQSLGVTRFLRRPIEPQLLINELETCLHSSRRENSRTSADANGHYPVR